MDDFYEISVHGIRNIAIAGKSCTCNGLCTPTSN